MKLKYSLTIGLLVLGLLAAARAQQVKLNVPSAADKPAAAAPAPAPAPTYTETQVLEVVGWFMGKNSQADTFEFTNDQIDAVTRGFVAALQGKEAPSELQKIGPQIEAYVHKKQDIYLAKLKEQGLVESAKFLAEIKQKPGVVALPSGLCYEIIKPGTGPNVKVTDTITANYTGTLINGTVFDSSLQTREGGAPPAPAEFPLNGVIAGWTEGLQQINKGGTIKLYVPPQLAYGDDGRPGIPPGSTLIFTIDVLDFKPTPGPASLAPMTGK
ncbi:MAG: FKBP-type peptidyl-prolyl cis-trans isomerase [Opitutaceae bacterium]|nr:FKBP-type peptidyl-prolyl cis-trans isomerase [Opitutaceae bacterium]